MAAYFSITSVGSLTPVYSSCGAHGATFPSVTRLRTVSCAYATQPHHTRPHACNRRSGISFGGDHHLFELVALHCQVKELSSVVAEFRSAARCAGRQCLWCGIHNLFLVLPKRIRREYTATPPKHLRKCSRLSRRVSRQGTASVAISGMDCPD